MNPPMFYRAQSYGRRFLMQKNTGIDTNLDATKYMLIFGHWVAQKWHKMAIRWVLAV